MQEKVFIIWRCCYSVDNLMTTHVISNSIDNVHVNNAGYIIEIIFILKAIRSSSEGSYDKQNLTLLIISYEINETR